MRSSLCFYAGFVALAAMSLSCSSTRSAGTAAAGEQADADVDATLLDAGEEASLAEEASGCGVVVPPCPDPPPSYANEVALILDAKCNNCHRPEVSGAWPLTNYEDTYAWMFSIASDIARCVMPPVDAGTPALTTAEQTTVLGWIMCNAPNN